MIKSIYIIQEDGILLYSQNITNEITDTDIMVGFCASVANFGREAMGTFVHSMNLGNKNKLTIIPIPREEMLGIAVTNSLDDSSLVGRILRNIMRAFIDKHPSDCDPNDVDKVYMAKIVISEVRRKIVPTLKTRLIFSLMFMGLLIFFTVFMISLFFPDIESFMVTQNINPQITYTLYVFILFPIPNLVLGYLSVDKKVASIDSFLYIIILSLAFYIFLPTFVQYIVFSIPIAIALSLASSYIGVKLAGQRKFSR